MLATLVIGLREGLEAALIVGIIAAFLRRNGRRLWPMALGVIAAVLISIAVGVTLEVVSLALPQAEQEALESVIGAVAVFFVTGMIVWMRRHAGSLKSDLERSATAALGEGSTWALGTMAFLAVLKEGFETSVFLLATFQAATSASVAATGAVLGILIAIAIGYGIYRGGVRLDLGRFFRVTGVFLILVAAGLVITTLRTAHEAGWIVVGQARTVDLSWLAPAGSVRAALVTGVLGIPSDPRVMEVLGWFLYLVPALLFALWPQRWHPRNPVRARLVLAAGLAVVAVGLAVAAPSGSGAALSPAVAVEPTDAVGTVALVRHGAKSGSDAGAELRTGRGDRIHLPAARHTVEEHDGVAADAWTVRSAVVPAGLPGTLSLSRLATLNGGRIPVGIDATRNPGPFQAVWSATTTVSAWASGDVLLDATSAQREVLTVSGGGLPSSRTITVTGAATWAVPAAVAARRAGTVAAGILTAREAALWHRWLPVVLGIAALWLAGATLAARRRRPGAAAGSPAEPNDTALLSVPDHPNPRSTTHAA